MPRGKPCILHEGSGRARVTLSVEPVGDDLLVRLYNGQAHVGAVALAEYHAGARRASTSVLSRYGHKDDGVAYAAAYRICRQLRRTVCAVAGIHLDRIRKEEIEQIRANCSALVDRFLDPGGGPAGRRTISK